MWGKCCTFSAHLHIFTSLVEVIESLREKLKPCLLSHLCTAAGQWVHQVGVNVRLSVLESCRTFWTQAPKSVRSWKGVVGVSKGNISESTRLLGLLTTTENRKMCFLPWTKDKKNNKHSQSQVTQLFFHVSNHFVRVEYSVLESTFLPLFFLPSSSSLV